MKDFFKKNKNILLTTIIFVLVLATLLIFVKNKQLLNSNASDNGRFCARITTEKQCAAAASTGRFPCKWENEKCVISTDTTSTVSVSVRGAVALENTNALNQNRFTKERCPSKPFKTDVRMNVNSPRLGNANWDCIDPNFFFSQTQVTKGITTFTLTPPAGYRCVRAYYFLNDIEAGEEQNGCSLNVDISRGGRYFLWFIVQ